MVQLLRRCWWTLIVAAGLQSASAFSLLGPKEAFQTSALGYTVLTEMHFPATDWFILRSGSGIDYGFSPKNLGEEYRWNTPFLFYAYDQNFLDYFGSNGVQAVDSAVAILNALTNVSSYSAELSELPLAEARVNYTAAALHLFDLKSAALEMLVERLGLADPERWTWCLRARVLPPGRSCPAFDFSVIQRNFDPVTFAPSAYVNGNLFTYQWLQFCGTFDDRSDPIEVLVDPFGTYQTAVASPKISYPTIIYYGYFHTGLTRDDVGGLRYLYRTNNMNVEMTPPGTILFSTNRTTSQLLFTSNLTLLAVQALTNNAAQLEALYPGLIVAGTTNIFTNVVTTNVFAYFTNFPWSTPGSLATLVLVTNLSTNVQVQFRHTFANVITNTFFTNGAVTVLETNVTQAPWSPPGVLITNVTTQTVISNIVMGDFYIIPTNLCGFSIISTQLIRVLSDTNTPVVATNGFGVTNVNGQQFTRSFITYFTNFIFVVHPVDCVSNSVALRQGVEKINFIRRDFDSLLNRFFLPITNTYTMVAVTNNAPFVQTLQRVVTQPDILFSAADVGGNLLPIDTVSRTDPNFNTTNSLPGLIGPGTIEPPVRFQFNKVGPIRLNSGPFFVDEASAILYFIWASFDGTTNAPIIYPIGTSITELENQVFIQVSPPSLPTGTVGVPYNVQLSVTGGQPPYTWSLAPNSPPLPPTLMLVPDIMNSSIARISGTSIVAGTNNVLIRVTDAGARFVDANYLIGINSP